MAAPYPEPGRVSLSLAEYLPAFQGREDEPFLTFHPVSSASKVCSYVSDAACK